MDPWTSLTNSILKEATEKVLKASIALECDSNTAQYVLETLSGLGREVRVIGSHHREERRRQIC